MLFCLKNTNLQRFNNLFFIFIIVFPFLSFAQFEWNYNKKDRIVIPFKLVNNTIILDVQLKNEKLNFILDTGSPSNILFNFPNDSVYFDNTEKIKITGPGFKEVMDAYNSKNNIFQFKENIIATSDLVLLVEHDINFQNQYGMMINGIIGNQFFYNHLVEINYSDKKIVLFPIINKKVQNKLKNYSSIDCVLEDDKSYLFVELFLNDSKSKKYKLVFDTGLSDGVWLLNHDNEIIKQSMPDYFGYGLGGEILGKRERFQKIKLGDFIFDEPIISYPDSLAFSSKGLLKQRDGSVGGEVLKRFNLILDYTNNKIYFKKNSNFDLPFTYNMSGIILKESGFIVVKEKYSNNSAVNTVDLTNIVNGGNETNIRYLIKPGLEIQYIRLNSIAEKAGLKVGDKIISVNKRKVGELTLDQVSRIFNESINEKIILEIERNYKNIVFEFILKKEI